MINYKNKLCTKCVSPHTAESITFDKKGICSVCDQIEFKKKKINWIERKKLFDKLIQKHKGKHDYDCIVPFSGGKEPVSKSLKNIRVFHFFRIKLIELEYPLNKMIFECCLLNTAYMKNGSLLENSKSI